jgi:hypothetical protein
MPRTGCGSPIGAAMPAIAGIGLVMLLAAFVELAAG